jgi:ribonuclease T1
MRPALAAFGLALAAFLGAAPPAIAQKLDAAVEVPVSQLPQEARQTVSLIRKGGPYPYARDGTIFANREGRLPRQKRGYYREFTVKTPGERTRGARRIISGSAGDLWYTDDHYNTFRRVRD